jgi:hypothetical protein
VRGALVSVGGSGFQLRTDHSTAALRVTDARAVLLLVPGPARRSSSGTAPAAPTPATPATA